MFRFCNPNPCNILVGDCVIRACSIALDADWKTVHKDICDLSRERCNMPSANSVWAEYLHRNGLGKCLYYALVQYVNSADFILQECMF